MTPSVRRTLVVILVVFLLLWGFTDIRERAITDVKDVPSIRSHSTDVTVYTEAAAAFFDGRDPYSVANIRGWHYLYPPLFAILVAPLRHLPSQWQGVIWYLLSLLMAAGCVHECRAILHKLLDVQPIRAAWRETGRLIVIASALAVLLPVLDSLQRGQVAVAVLWPLLMGLRLTLADHQFSGGVVLALPVALRVTPALPILLLLVRMLVDAFHAERRRTARRQFLRLVAGVVAGTVLFFLVIPSVAIGWHANLRHLHTWYSRVASNPRLGSPQLFAITSVRNQSLSNAVYRLGNWIEHKVHNGPDDRAADNVFREGKTMPMDSKIHGRIVNPIRVVLLALLMLVTIAWRPATESLGQVALFGLASAMTLPLSPISWGHHYTILLPGVLFLPLALAAAGRRTAARAFALSAAVMVWVHYASLELPGRIAGRLGFLGISMSAWCAAASLYVLWSSRSTNSEPRAIDAVVSVAEGGRR